MEFTFENFKKMNASYDSEHGITEGDYQRAVKMKALIEAKLSDNSMYCRCDVVEYTDSYGDYYPAARIDSLTYWRDNEQITVCERPYLPWVYLCDNNTVEFGSMGGGVFVGVDKTELEYIGTTEALFNAWGHCGATGNGAFNFPATVKKWRANLRKGEFAQYSTKEYQRLRVIDNRDGLGYARNGSMYKFLGDGIAWKDEDELNRYLKQYKAVLDTELNTHSEITKIYWTYKPVDKYHFEQEAFDKIDAAPFYKWWNGSEREHKIVVDDEAKTVTTHINRSNEATPWRN